MKKILYFFPDNVGKQNAGNKTRALQLLHYFKNRGFAVDYVSLMHEKTDRGTEQETIEMLTSSKLATNVHLLPRKPGKGNLLWYFFRYKVSDLFYHWIKYPLRSNIPPYLTIKLKHAFNKVLKQNDYDYIVISYVQCAGLIDDRALLKGSRTIIDTHDLITGQLKNKRNFSLGATFEDEISRLNTFDEVWAISSEEQYVFSQFIKKQVRLVPFIIEKEIEASPTLQAKKYDLIYVASDNVHNQRSSNWFFHNVYPLLPKGIRICVIGLINKFISKDIDVTRIAYAENLESYYTDARIALCPMLTGTGVKVKVVEALGYGLPVVSTTRGVDGLPNKRLNGCLVSDDATKFAENITILLNDNVFYHRLRIQALDFIRSSFSKEVLYSELDSAFK